MRKAVAVITALILFLTLTGCSPNPAEQPEKAKNQENSKTDKDGAAKEQASTVKTVEVTVRKVLDGDTIHVGLNGKDESVRLIGANAPELSHPQLKIKEQPYGKLAADYSKQALLNKRVYLEFDIGERDRYGRALAYVWLQQPKDSSETEVREKLFNARLLLDGYAQIMTIAPNVKYAELFKKFEREAREGKKGLWGTSGEKPNDRYNN